ncbi:MAG TPA: lysophospholipid acyltransferase family protein [Chitinispirillaceae bacterium]|nr:lysophospholipid acyltransferase family protein [Chitinispirillaceae bacterium]
MDREKRGLNLFELIRVPIFLVWVIFSTVAYSLGCVFFCFAPTISRFIARMWTIHLLWIGGVNVIVNGKNKLDPHKRYVFISNHQSALDIPVIMAGLSHYVCFIAKKELFMIPFFGWGITVMGHICIDRSNARKAKESLTKAVNQLKKQNSSLILFPEGTRSQDGKVGEFKQGSFSLALQAGVQVVPLAIRDAMLLLPKKSARINSGNVYLDIGDPIDILPETTKTEICQKVHSIIKAAAEKQLEEKAE